MARDAGRQEIMDKLHWGIIGCGDVTEVKSGPAFNRVEHSSLVAVMRRDAAKAADYARRHGVPTWYTDADQLINDPDVNAVYVATPPRDHEAYTIAALAAGKPVYVEKPMALTSAAAERMQAASVRYGVPLCVAHYRRELPLFRQIKHLLDTQQIGTVKLVTIRLWQPVDSLIIGKTPDNWRVNPALSGGGLLFDLAPHQLDLMYYFFGKAEEVSGLSANQAGLYAAEDIVTGMMRLPNNILFTGQWCFSVPTNLTDDVCEIIGSAGSIRFPMFGKQYTIQADGREETVVVEPPAHIQQPMIDAVVRYFRGVGPNPCPADEAIAMFNVMETFTGRGG